MPAEALAPTKVLLDRNRKKQRTAERGKVYGPTSGEP